MRKEVLQATIAEIAKTACCAWEDYAKRNRGVDEAGLFASQCKERWATVVDRVRAGTHDDMRRAKMTLCLLGIVEMREKQARGSYFALEAILAYEREADPC